MLKLSKVVLSACSHSRAIELSKVVLSACCHSRAIKLSKVVLSACCHARARVSPTLCVRAPVCVTIQRCILCLLHTVL